MTFDPVDSLIKLFWVGVWVWIVVWLCTGILGTIRDAMHPSIKSVPPAKCRLVIDPKTDEKALLCFDDQGRPFAAPVVSGY